MVGKILSSNVGGDTCFIQYQVLSTVVVTASLLKYCLKLKFVYYLRVSIIFSSIAILVFWCFVKC